MREALGNTFIMNIVLFIIVILIGVVVSSLAFTKAYKVKNMIINTIEENNGWNMKARSAVDDNLRKIGYKLNINGVQTCSDPTGNQSTTNCKLSAMGSNYHYCVYTCNAKRGTYYRVTSYMYFDIPAVSNMFEFPIHGETKTFINLGGLQ